MCRIIVFSLFFIVVGCCTVAFADDMTPIAYTANLQDNTASIIDMNDNSIVATIYGLDLPAGIAVSPDYKRIYVTNSGSNTVAVINATTYQIIDTIPVGRLPYGIGISPDGAAVYVANNDDNTLSVIDPGKGKIVYNVSVGRAPYGVRVNPANGDIYVANSLDGTISVIRGKVVIATIAVGKSPTNGMAVSPDGSLLFVANTDSNNVSIIDTSAKKVQYSVETGIGPRGVAISQDGSYAYITNAGSQNVSIMQISDRSIRVSLTIGNVSQVAASPDGKVLYIVTAPDGKIKAIYSATGETLGHVDVHAFDIGTMAVSSAALIDTTPPATTLTFYGVNDSAGEFIKEVTINLTAADYPSGTQIDDIHYSWDGLTWNPYSGNITLRNARSVLLYYYATDKYGNKEPAKSRWVNIVDTMPTPATPIPSPHPSLTIPPKPTALPPEQIFTVTPQATAATPVPTSGFELVLAMVGLCCAGYSLRKKMNRL